MVNYLKKVFDQFQVMESFLELYLQHINNLKTGFTQLSEQFGWVGQLEDFDPSIGYWIQTPVSGWIKFRYTN